MGSPVAASARPRKILIVEDEEAVFHLLEVTLREPDRYQLLTAKDGCQALELARSESPDLIFLDIRLPKIDGFKVCRELKSDPRTGKIKIVMITALAQASYREEGMEAGADAYVTKPFSPRELLKLMGEMFEGDG